MIPYGILRLIRADSIERLSLTQIIADQPAKPLLGRLGWSQMMSIRLTVTRLVSSIVKRLTLDATVTSCATATD